MKKSFTYDWSVSGAKLSASICPCSWMYFSYGLKIMVDMKDGGQVTVLRKDIKFEKATEADVIAMCESIRVIPCKTCGKPAFDPETVDTNRDGVCESCWMAEWQKDWDSLMEEKRQEQAKKDREMYNKGYRHKVTAWVHPKQWGDDYEDVRYFKDTPSKSEITNHLKRDGSSVTDDYLVETLKVT